MWCVQFALCARDLKWDCEVWFGMCMLTVLYGVLDVCGVHWCVWSIRCVWCVCGVCGVLDVLGVCGVCGVCVVN